MKKIILLFIFYTFIINNQAFSIEDVSGDVLIKYNFDNLTKGDYKYVDEGGRLNGGLYIYSKQDMNLIENLYLKSTLLFKTFGRRVYNGAYGKHSAIANNSRLNDDFYGKENYLKRKIYFDHYGLALEEIAFEYKEDAFLFGLGKFNPKFGIAYDESKLTGNYSTLLAKKYEMKEKIGGYLGINSENFKLIFNTFYDDNSFLSDTLFYNRGRNKGKNGIGNTRKFNNFSIFSEAVFSDYKINLGFRRLATTNSQERSEKGYVFGIQKYFEETEYSIGANPLFEIAYLDNYNGNKYRNLTTTTFRLPIFYKGWQFIASHSYQYNNEKHAKDYMGYVSELSLGYKFKNGLLISAGKNWVKDINKTVDNAAREKETYKYRSYNINLSYIYEY